MDERSNRSRDELIEEIHALEARLESLHASDIALQRARDQLEISESRLTSFINAAPIAMGLVRERTFLWVGDRVCEMTGYSRDELVGSSTRIIYPSDEEFERVGRVKYAQFETSSVGEVETRWVTRDGRVLEVLLRSSPLYPGDTAKGTTFTALDLTERKRDEENRQSHLEFLESLERIDRLLRGADNLQEVMSRSLAFLQDLFDTDRLWLMEPCIATWTPRRIRAEVSRERMSGTLTELMARGWVNLDHECGVALGSPEPVVLGEGSRHRSSEELIRELGVRSQLLLVLHVKPGPAWMLGFQFCRESKQWSSDELGLIKEIGRRMSDSISSMLSLQAIQQSEQKYRSMMEAMEDMVYIVSSNHRVEYLNPAMVRRLGRDVTGQQCYRAIHDRSSPCEWCSWDRLDRGLSQKTEIRSPRDGRIFSVISTPLGHPSGNLSMMSMLRDISEIKDAEAALRQREEDLRITLNSIGDAVIATDSGGRVLSMNPVAEQLTGWEIWQAEGIPIERVYQTLDIGVEALRVNPARMVLDSGGEYRSMENRVLISRSGVRRYVSESAAPIRNRDGDLMGVVLVFRDVTDAYENQLKLQESEEKFKLISEQSLLSIVIIQDGFMRYVSNAFTHLIGFSVPEILAWEKEEFAKVIHPDDLRFVMEQARRKQSGEPSVVTNYSYRLVSRNGDIHWVDQYSATVIFQGRFADLVTMVDITDRKAAEEEMKQLRNFLKNIVDSMPSILIGVDVEGRITQWNMEAEETLRIKAWQALGAPLHQAFPQLPISVEAVREALDGGRPLREEFVLTDPSGEKHHMDLTLYPLLAEGGEGAVIRVDDVTERMRIKEMMLQSEKMLSVGGLAAGMAHEINNPLAGILQSLQVISNRFSPELPANHRVAESLGIELQAIRRYMEERQILRFMDSIRDSGLRAAKIVDNMLSFSRKGGSRQEPHQLGELVDRTLDLASNDYDLKKKYDFRQIVIHRDYAPGMPSVPCERSKIQQVLLNVFKNGAEAMAEGPRDGKLRSEFRIRIYQDDSMGCIEIQDNGPGMDEGVRKRVFEPFFTTKSVGVGTGLGLSVSYFIITEDHRGTMAVESEPGGGALFTIRLPLVRG